MQQTYQQFLSSPYWFQCRELVLQRDNYSCKKCGATGPVLMCHHKAYRVNGESIVGKELRFLDLLETLCGVCHYAEHGKKYGEEKPDYLPSPDELTALVEPFPDFSTENPDSC